jgi:hypothetical protein
MNNLDEAVSICLAFDECLIQISARTSWHSSVLSANKGLLLQIRPQPVSSTSFLIHYSLIILSFGAIIWATDSVFRYTMHKQAGEGQHKVGMWVDSEEFWPLLITGFSDFVHRSVFWRAVKNRTFRKLDQFPSSDEGVGDTYSAGSVRKS